MSPPDWEPGWARNKEATLAEEQTVSDHYDILHLHPRAGVLMDEKRVFCQVAADLDTNPKIRAAGLYGSVVYQFVLRLNAQRGFWGFVPVAYLRPEYLSGILMMSASEARDGVMRAVTAELLELDETTSMVHIVGWDPRWGARPQSNAERQAAYRHRKKLKPQLQLPMAGESNGPLLRVTAGDESNGLDKTIYSAREDLGPRLVLVRPEPDPEIGGRRDLVSAREADSARQVVAPEPTRDRSPATASEQPAPDPRAAEQSRLLRKLMGLHVAAFNALRLEFGSRVPSMQPVGDPTERALRDLLESQGSLTGFEESALHVLAVREAEARDKRELKFFGTTVWKPDSYGFARTMEVGQARAPSRSAAVPRYEPASAEQHALDALKGEKF